MKTKLGTQHDSDMSCISLIATAYDEIIGPRDQIIFNSTLTIIF